MNIEITIAEKSTFVMPLSCIGQITPVVPRISRMLKTLDPSTLPMAIPLLPFFAATTLVASSGMDVPIATMVSPVTASLTPIILATSVALSTNKLLPKTNITSPANMNNAAFHIAISRPASFGILPSSDATRDGSSKLCSPLAAPSFSFSFLALAPARVIRINTAKRSRRIIESIREREPSRHSNRRSTEATSAKGMSFLTVE